jgi:hypothetical protein
MRIENTEIRELTGAELEQIGGGARIASDDGEATPLVIGVLLAVGSVLYQAINAL